MSASIIAKLKNQISKAAELGLSLTTSYGNYGLDWGCSPPEVKDPTASLCFSIAGDPRSPKYKIGPISKSDALAFCEGVLSGLAENLRSGHKIERVFAAAWDRETNRARFASRVEYAPTTASSMDAVAEALKNWSIPSVKESERLYAQEKARLAKLKADAEEGFTPFKGVFKIVNDLDPIHFGVPRYAFAQSDLRLKSEWTHVAKPKALTAEEELEAARKRGLRLARSLFAYALGDYRRVDSSDQVAGSQAGLNHPDVRDYVQKRLAEITDKAKTAAIDSLKVDGDLDSMNGQPVFANLRFKSNDPVVAAHLNIDLVDSKAVSNLGRFDGLGTKRPPEVEKRIADLAKRVDGVCDELDGTDSWVGDLQDDLEKLESKATKTDERLHILEEDIKRTHKALVDHLQMHKDKARIDEKLGRY